MSDRKTCPGSPDRPWHWRRVLAVSLAGMGLVFGSAGPGSSVPSADKKPVEFKEAIKAQDQGDWKKSAELIRIALQRQPEDGERVRIYGTKFRSYLPHYYLGLALYKQGDCDRALREWEECISIGAIQAKEEQDSLGSYLSDCRNRRPRS